MFFLLFLLLHHTAPTKIPLTISVVSFDNGSITVTWQQEGEQPDQPVSGNSYRLIISPAPVSGPDEIIITDPDVDSAEFTGLMAGTNHVITLEALGGSNHRPDSEIEQYTSELVLNSNHLVYCVMGWDPFSFDYNTGMQLNDFYNFSIPSQVSVCIVGVTFKVLLLRFRK